LTYYVPFDRAVTTFIHPSAIWRNESVTTRNLFSGLMKFKCCKSAFHFIRALCLGSQVNLPIARKQRLIFFSANTASCDEQNNRTRQELAA